MPIVLLAANTGLRRGELFNLCWRDVDLPRQVLTVLGSGAKGGRTRHVPINQDTLVTLSAWADQTDSSPAALIFPSPVTGQRFDNINSAWEGLMKAANIESVRFHDLRHTFASKLVMRGADLYTVKELLGHSNIEMTQRYAHLSPDHKSATVALLNNRQPYRPLTIATCQSALAIERESMH